MICNPPSRPAQHGPQRGFLLLDSLVALALAGLLLTGLLTASRMATQASARAAHAGAVRHVAQTVLERLGADLPIDAGHWQGTDPQGPVDWTLHITPLATRPDVHTNPDAGTPPMLRTLHAITVTAIWNGPPPAARLTLVTRRIGSTPATEVNF